MARPPVFDSPLLLGFDEFERMLERVAKTSSEGYPPYNIEQVGDTGLRITLAVAGFSKEDLSVTIEENQLIVRGRSGADDDGRVFLYKGIAARQFQRSFLLADGIEVVGADLERGLLHVDLQRVMPERKARTIAIRSGRESLPSNGPTVDVSGKD